MSGVYLSLNQGWTQFKNAYKTKRGRERIKEAALGFRSLMSVSPDSFSFEDIDLISRNNLGRGYELGHICGKEYPKDNIPHDDELIQDLKELQKTYEEIIRMMEFKSYPECFYNI